MIQGKELFDYICKPMYHERTSKSREKLELKFEPHEDSFLLCLGINLFVHLGFSKIIGESERFEKIKQVFVGKNEIFDEDDEEFMCNCLKIIEENVKIDIRIGLFTVFEFSDSRRLVTLKKYMLRLANWLDFENLCDPNAAELEKLAETLEVSFRIKYEFSVQSGKQPLEMLINHKKTWKSPYFMIKKFAVNEITTYSTVITHEILVAFEHHKYSPLFSELFYVNNAELLISHFKDLVIEKTEKQSLVQLNICENISENIKENIDFLKFRLELLEKPCIICPGLDLCQCHHLQTINSLCPPCRSLLQNTLKTCALCQNRKKSSLFLTFSQCFHTIHLICLARNSKKCPC